MDIPEEKDIDKGINEIELVKGLKSGEREAFEMLAKAYEKKIFATAMRFTKNTEDAADITQDVFLRIYRYINMFKGQSSLATWIYRITVNLCTDTQKKDNVRRNMETESAVSDDGELIELQIADTAKNPDEEYESKENIQIVREAINELSDEHKSIIILRDIEGLTYEEICEILNVSLGTVKSRISRARERLKNILVDNGNFFH